MKILKNFVFAAAVFFLSVFFCSSFAGYRGDRLVVWVNLDENPDVEKVDDVISVFINSRRIDSTCHIEWHSNQSFLYMDNRPTIKINRLAKKVFIEKSQSDMVDLNKYLKKFRDKEGDVLQGLDGVVVYSSKNGPQMMSFVTGRKKIQIRALKTIDSKPTKASLENAFCQLLPPTTRPP